MASKSSSSKTKGTKSLMASLPDDPESSVATPTTAKSGTGVLSRTSLYTPLSFYTSQRASANNTKKQQPNIPKNAQESSLVEFMATTVSTAYHLSSEGRGNTSNNSNSSVTVLSVKHARNTGNRPLNVGEINGRIRQRALTLVGGGYNASVVTGGDVAGSNRAVIGAATATKQQAMNAHGKRSAVAANSRSRTSADRQQRRQRKRQKKTAANNGGVTPPVIKGADNVSSCQTDTDNSDHVNVDTDMLRQLHTMWLDYLWNLLGIVLPSAADTSRNNDKGSNNSKTKTKKGAASATITRSPLELVRSKLPGLLLQTTTASGTKATPGAVALELVGAKVRVQACARHPACQGRTGILVQATADTYQIAVVRPSAVVGVVQVPATLQDAAETVTAGVSTTSTAIRTPSPQKPTIQTWIIPKRGSRLELLLPVDHLTNKHRAGTTVDVDPFSSGSSDQPQLCILLDSNQHQPARINK
jgi:RNase P/RNase MRP subunit p29